MLTGWNQAGFASIKKRTKIEYDYELAMQLNCPDALITNTDSMNNINQRKLLHKGPLIKDVPSELDLTYT